MTNMWGKKYKTGSATETMDVYYIVEGSVSKRSWHFKKWGEDCLMSCQGHCDATSFHKFKRGQERNIQKRSIKGYTRVN